MQIWYMVGRGPAGPICFSKFGFGPQAYHIYATINSRNYGIQLIGMPIIHVFWKGTFFFVEKKKAPARDARHRRPSLFSPKTQIQGILTKLIPFSEKVREAKWRHKFPLSNANPFFFHFQKINSFWRKSPKVDYLPISCLLFAYLLYFWVCKTM